MKIKVMKSIEGGEYKEVLLDEVLFDSLLEYKQANESFNYLLTRNILDDKIIDKLGTIIKGCEVIFNQYKLDKYDVRAKYKFEKAKKINI